jgi:hypothetical protein
MSHGANRSRPLLGLGGTGGANVLLEHVALDHRPGEGVGLWDANVGIDIGCWPTNCWADPLAPYYRRGARRLGARIRGSSDRCGQGPEHAEGRKEQPPARKCGGKAVVRRGRGAEATLSPEIAGPANSLVIGGAEPTSYAADKSELVDETP